MMLLSSWSPNCPMMLLSSWSPLCKNSHESNIIGQFGVGFYSAFVVADNVDVYTRSYDGSKGGKGYKWSSDGTGTFTISEAADLPRGTKIVLKFKDDALEFSKVPTVKKAAEKFSSFIDFPITVMDGDEAKEITKQEAVWTKRKATEEEHTQFFRYLNS